MKKPIRLIYFLLLVFVGSFSYSCGKKNVDDVDSSGKLVVVEKVINLISYPGKNRVKLTWEIPVNTDVQKFSIKWGNGTQQSKEVLPLNASANMEVILEELAEGNYTFSVTTIDTKGNTSGITTTSGRVYGTKYEEALVNRPIKDITYNENTKNVVINWNSAGLEEKELEIKYTDASNVLKVVTVPKSADQTTLINFKSDNSFEYRTTFQPEGSINLFYAAYKSVTPNQFTPPTPYLGTDWLQYTPVKKIHLDDDVGLQTSNWVAYKSVCSPVICADYSYNNNTLTETFQILNSKSNRSEIRIEDNYSTGSRQFSGYVKFDAPLNDESLMQIFGSTSENATQLMIRGYAENGGTLKISTSFVLATGVYNKEVHINVIHLQDDVGGKMIVYIDGVKKYEKVDDENATNYMKYGCYGTMKTGTASVQWRDVRFYKNGKAPI